MDVKDKLVELIANSNKDENLWMYDLSDLTDKRSGGAEYFADYLIANGVTVQEWISVEDRLPERYGIYLVYDGDLGNYFDCYFDECVREFGEWQICFDRHTLGAIDSEWISYPNITHWMPLPPAPEDVK